MRQHPWAASLKFFWILSSCFGELSSRRLERAEIGSLGQDGFQSKEESPDDSK